MALQRSKLKLVGESQSPADRIDSIVEAVAELRTKMESSSDPGYGYGQSTGKSAGAGPKPKFTKKSAPKA